MFRNVAALSLFVLLSGCATFSRVSHPDTLLTRYVEAIESGDIDGAYALLSEAQRHRVSRAEFREAAGAYPQELEAQARELRRQMAEPISVSGEVPMASGERAIFILQDGHWRITEGAAGAASLTSPLQTIRVLRRALQRRSYPGVLRVLSREARSQLEDEISRIIEGLEDEEALSVEVTGNRARVVYDENHFVDLQREDGEWVIVDMD